MVSGSNTCISYNVLKDIGKFNETRMIAEDLSRGYDILSKGYKIYVLNDHKSKIHTDFPKNIKELIEQRKRYFENDLLLSYKSKEINYWENFARYLLKFIWIACVSFYILLSPILILFNLGLFFIGLILILTIYLKKIRKLIFFKKALGGENYRKFRRIIYIKLIFYIYIELVVNVIALFSSILFIKMIKREENGNINNE